MIEIEFNNQTRYAFPKKAVERVLAVAEKKLRLNRKESVSLAFVNEIEIRRLNNKYRKKNKVTDVLSFKIEEVKNIGEIIICPAQAKKQAEELGQSYQKEIVKLALHGYLHIQGFDHENEVEAKKMERLELKILNLSCI